MNNHVSVLEINGKALEHNLNYFKERLESNTKILAVVKAFGYGSDGLQVASFLQDKVDYFAVAYTHEGEALRNAGIEMPILVLHPQIQNIDQLVKNRLEPSIYNFKVLAAFLDYADENLLMNYPIHLKFNTGLNRLGLWHNDIPLILSKIHESKHVKIQSIFSHLAASEDHDEKDFTINQINNFAYIVKQIYEHLDYEPMIHILNTSGVVNYPQAQFDMVRIGIGLYGFGNDEKETSQLKNTHVLKSIISQIHMIEPGETVGYNRAFVSKGFSKTATIPIGHADGISRKLGNENGYVIINNQKASIIGNVCMDMIMIDITKIDCKEGDEVYIFKTQEDILHMAEKTETISYEILTAISQRIKRVLTS
ncbi:alanine racemase [Pseudotenacibaculum sp. MALMAid0570]|uniref:alanine racemase n=1 Tax=Pseudotenacibaculum sp. MALMAid0570 TaxID=3143938 RepID=UPI0032DE549B